jgi:hypothetical protein
MGSQELSTGLYPEPDQSKAIPTWRKYWQSEEF